MGDDAIKDDTSLKLPVAEGFYLQISNSRKLASQWKSILNLMPTRNGSRPICIIEADQGLKQGLAIDFENFSPGCKLKCHPDTPISELLPLINILLPATRSVSMHASAFTWKGRGIAITGNAGSGKTGALLAAINRGAGSIGDECLWLDRKAGLRGILVDMEIRSDYFYELPNLKKEVSAITLSEVYLYDLIGRCISHFLPKLSRKFKGRARAHLHPDIVKRHLDPDARIDRLFISEVYTGANINVSRTSLSEIIPRLMQIQRTEFARQYELYQRFRDDSAGQRNEWMETLDRRMEELFNEALQNTQTYIIERPASITANALFNAIDETCD